MSHIIAERLSQAYIQPSASGIESFPVLKDISLEVQEGEFITVFGPNGSGNLRFLELFPDLKSLNRDMC